MYDAMFLLTILFREWIGEAISRFTLYKMPNIRFLLFVGEIKKWWLYVLLVIAAILCLTGVGLWIALGVLIYSKLLARLPCLLVHASVNSLASFHTVHATGHPVFKGCPLLIIQSNAVLFGNQAERLYSFHAIWDACKPFRQLPSCSASLPTIHSLVSKQDHIALYD